MMWISSPGSFPAANDHDEAWSSAALHRETGEQVSEEAPEPLRLLRAREVAERLGISQAQVWELLRTGDIRSVKIGASRRVRSDEVDRYIRSLPQDGAA
jgi:excisionase family DNA binding protein